MNVIRRFLASPGLLRAREVVRGTLGAAEGVRLGFQRRFTPDHAMVPGLVSVIVPAYDVEEYLEETLESLQKQNYRSVEIIVVDDGSPDNVAAITRRKARFDSRIRLVRQENRGLSGARNAGVKHARGEFITFIDSDDTVDRHIFTNAVTSLQETGSDFAVYPYRRYFKSQYPPAAYWVREAHEEYRAGVTLAEVPEIMVNAVAWSKLYRRSFWDRHDFAFPEGLLYEDQALSCRAYALAEGFDVLSIVSINWRIREDQSSISQKLAEQRNIRDHALAVQHSVRFLEDAGYPELAERRLAQVLSYNLGEFVAILGDLTEDAWNELVKFVTFLRGALSDDAWREQVQTKSKIVVQLILDGERESLLEFLSLGGWTSDRVPFRFTGSELLPELEELLPTYAERANNFPRALDETALRTGVVGVRDLGDSGSVLELDYLVPSLDPAHIESVSVDLIDRDGQLMMELPVTTRTHQDEFSVIPGNYWEVRRAEVGLANSVLAALLESEHAELRMTVQADQLVRAGYVQGSREKGPLGAHLLPGAAGVVDFALDPRNGRLILSRRGTPSVEVVATEFADDSVVLSLASDAPIDRVLVVPNDQFVLHRGLAARHHHQPDGEVRVSIPQRLLSRGSDPSTEYRILCVDSEGVVSHARVATPTQTVFDPRSQLSVAFLASPDRLRLQSYREGSERVAVPSGAALISAMPRVLIDECSIEDDAIVFTSSRHNLSLAGAAEQKSWQFSAEGTGRVLLGSIAESQGVLTMRVPLDGNAWGQPGTATEPDTYTLRLTENGEWCSIGLSQTAVMDWVPKLLRRDDMNIEVKRSARGYCEVVVRPPLKDGDGGPNGYRLKNWYAPRLEGPRKKQILFRSLYGEVANDSALAVFRELQDRDSDLDLVWSIKDRSVAVPEGASTVIDGTRAFYEAYAESEYLMVNVHQADWSTKPAGQKIIQTFHGYPFKLAGRRWWRELGFSAARVESYFRRALEWDYLLSPAPYATEHLREFLPEDRVFPGEILELGYPRNDVLVNDDGEIRRRTRERLGIAPDAKVLLYGPTFRDYLSADDMSAKLVDFLQVDELAEALGDEWVILLRGHPFNARHGVKSNAHVLNVTYYPEINDLILASDAGLLDYSSLRFDYALTDKPMMFLTPDRERYFSGRQSFEPYELTSPGPHLQNTEDVIAALKSVESVGADFAAARAEFRARFMPLEDGNAAARLVDAVFVPRGDARPRRG